MVEDEKVWKSGKFDWNFKQRGKQVICDPGTICLLPLDCTLCVCACVCAFFFFGTLQLKGNDQDRITSTLKSELQI